jgi:hypothetical protein
MKEFKLDQESKITTGFKTPENYFDHFQVKMLQELPENKPRVISLFSHRKAWLLAIAAVFIMALSIPIINQINRSSTDIDKATLENYLTNHADLTDDDLVEVLDVEDIQKMKVDFKIEDKDLEDILSTNSNLEEYIIN